LPWARRGDNLLFAGIGRRFGIGGCSATWYTHPLDWIMPTDPIKLEYEFLFQDGSRKSLRVHLRKPDLSIVPPTVPSHPDWAQLTCHQCPNCPLDPTRHPHCPVAVSLSDVIETFRDCLSTTTAEITIRSGNRNYHRQAPVQYGVSSLMGIYMVTSGCPILDKLRPMVLTHLPFATIDETIVRLTSMYLLAQYFIQQRGGIPDWKLRRLVDLCDAVGNVNQAFARRLLSINPQDASLNALANLDCFTLSTAFSIDRDKLKDLEVLFQAYWTDPALDPAVDDDPVLL
jgi:hypothetical protein